MKMEILADKTLDWFERMMESPWRDRWCQIVAAMAALYMGSMFLRIIIR